MNLVIGADGLLGKTLYAKGGLGTTRRSPTEDSHLWPLDLSTYLSKIPEGSLAVDYLPVSKDTVAYLCAGTKGYAECEGNREAFRADVDGNIRLSKQLLRRGAFVVFISTDGVEWGAHTAYARNRLLVEMALVMQPNVAIIRPCKFNADTVKGLAEFCIDIGDTRKEGVHYWGYA